LAQFLPADFYIPTYPVYKLLSNQIDWTVFIDDYTFEQNTVLRRDRFTKGNKYEGVVGKCLAETRSKICKKNIMFTKMDERARKLCVFWNLNLLMVLIAITLCGCLTSKIPSEPITITFAFPESPDRKRYQALAEEFQQEQAHITVELKANPGGEIIREADSNVDAFIWWPDPSLSTGERLVIQPIGTLLDKTEGFSRSDFYPRSVEMY
jgi:hypothetical protein